jgi:hypothetical protein
MNSPVDSFTVEVVLVDVDDVVSLVTGVVLVSNVDVVDGLVRVVVVVVIDVVPVEVEFVVVVVSSSSPLTCIGGTMASKQTESKNRVSQSLRIPNRLRP